METGKEKSADAATLIKIAGWLKILTTRPISAADIANLNFAIVCFCNIKLLV